MTWAAWALFKYPLRRLILRSHVKSRSLKIGSLDYCIALKFERHLGRSAAEMPVKFQGDQTILNTNPVASRDLTIRHLIGY